MVQNPLEYLIFMSCGGFECDGDLSFFADLSLPSINRPYPTLCSRASCRWGDLSAEYPIFCDELAGHYLGFCVVAHAHRGGDPVHHLVVMVVGWSLILGVYILFSVLSLW